MVYPGLETVLWQFYFPTEEEKKQNIVVKILCDIKGCRPQNFDHIVRFKNVKVVSKLSHPKTYKEYTDVELVFEDGAFDDVDESKIEATKREIRKVLYNETFLKLPEVEKNIEVPFDIMKSDIY